MQSLKYFLPILVVVAISGDASADDQNKWYAEAYAGSISPDFGEDGVDDFALVGARIGYNFTSTFSVEGDISTGTNTQSRSSGFITPVNSQAPLIVVQTDDRKLNAVVGVFGKATLPVSERFSAFARLGLAGIETSIKTVSESNSMTNNFERASTYTDVKAALGFGGTYNLTDRVYARAEITRYGLKTDTFDSELDSVTIGAGFRF